MSNITKLTPSLFLIVLLMTYMTYPKTSHKNVVQINTRIFDCPENWNILLFKEAIKIKEKKRILNTGLQLNYNCFELIASIIYQSYLLTYFICFVYLFYLFCCYRTRILWNSGKGIMK